MMKGKLIPSLLAAGMTALAGTSAMADEELVLENPQQDGAAVVDDETPSLWFVELQSAPTADGTSASTVRAEQAAFRSAANAAQIDYTERFAFEALFNGVSVEVPRGQAESLARLAGVRQLWPVIHIKASDEPSVPDMFTALNMTGANIAQSSLGLTGAGVRVAIMDTGVDYHHPDLGGCFGPGCRVETGWDFVGDLFNADPASPAFNPIAVPDPFPDDCNGHGSHVAGIAGANGTIRGVAPGITYGAYRVFGCDGSTTADIMLAAMEMALADGMDVLNMSIGSAFQWPQYPTAKGADRLVNRGVVVTASIGNSGANGLYSASAPGLGRKVIGVANFVNTHSALRHFTVSPDDRQVGYNQATASPPAPLSGSGLLARTGTPASVADACNGATAPAPGSLTGRIALIRRGTCGFFEKALNAQNAGATGVVLYNNVAGRVNPTVAGAVPITIPVVAVTAADGVVMNDRIAAGDTTLTWRATFFSEPVGAGAGLISASSSYGLGADLSLKPDIGAPGGLIMSTIPLELGGFGSNSGTSMAAPHIAGAAALMLQKFPHMSAAQIQIRLQNTADPQPWFGNPALGFLDNVHRQGAGLADIDDAITTTTALEPSQVELGEMEAGASETHELTLRNRSNQHVTYTIGHQPALATGANTFTPSFLSSFATATFESTTVVVPPRGAECVKVTITPPVNANARLFGGYITATPDNGGPATRASYAGYNGDYQAIQVLVPTTNNFPWLARLSGTTFTNQPAGATYTMVGQDTPQFLAHFDHQARRLRIDIYDVATGKLVGRSHNQQYLARNSTATSFFAFAWDGTVQKGHNTLTVPDGTYRAELSVLKALGDESNPAHTERWTSPNITIDRP